MRIWIVTIEKDNIVYRGEENGEMSILEGLRQLILGPIELVLDVIFALAMKITNQPVMSIAILSLAVNLLILPLYNRADAMQKEERELSLRLKPGMDHIKKVFHGDERFMMLQTYYRQNHYKPYYALKGSLSLLLQIPFFMAAYQFLSNLKILQNVGWGPIRSLSLPDGLLTIGSMSINLLPVLMTIINIFSGFVYMRGMPLKSKVQLYGMAGVFLVLLYQSPAGLTLYWTLNNVFSLGKNLIGRCKNPRKVIAFACSLFGIALGFLTLFSYQAEQGRKGIWIVLFAAGMQIPLFMYLLRKKHPRKQEPKDLNLPGYRHIFLLSCLVLTVLSGAYIPAAVIKSSPAEFTEIQHFYSPMNYILNAFLLAAGFFQIWLSVFFGLASSNRKKNYALILAITAVAGLANYMFFGGQYGNMSASLVYDNEITNQIHAGQILLNTGSMLVVAGTVWLIWKKKPVVIQAFFVTVCIALIGMSAVDIISIRGRMPEMERLAGQNQQNDAISYRLDRNGKNVIVLMMDRAIGAFVPYMFQERPELQEQFTGFVFYPNTLSYGHNTNAGSPALYGGYEYLPEKMNQRTDLLLKDKQNEALKIMPVNFLQHGFEVTVSDPPLANYQWIPDLSIFNDYPEIRTFNAIGKISKEDSALIRIASRNRNFFCYSIFRMAPVGIHAELYDDGNYNQTDAEKNVDQYSYFMDSYEVLSNLPRFFSIQDSGENTFLMMSNDTTHDVLILKEPEYEPQRGYVDNAAYDQKHSRKEAADGSSITLVTESQREHYQCNMAAMIQIGKWLDYLRKENVYDNTRIIIVADHGRDLGFPGMINDAAGIDVLSYNPLLMVKDFNRNEHFEISSRFMTNADTPFLACKGLMDNPYNPFLRVVLSDQDKKNEIQTVCSTNWNAEINNGFIFADSKYYNVRTTDILNPENWSQAE